jgi:hypothetical protein
MGLSTPSPSGRNSIKATSEVLSKRSIGRSNSQTSATSHRPAQCYLDWV